MSHVEEPQLIHPGNNQWESDSRAVQHQAVETFHTTTQLWMGKKAEGDQNMMQEDKEREEKEEERMITEKRSLEVKTMQNTDTHQQSGDAMLQGRVFQNTKKS